MATLSGNDKSVLVVIGLLLVGTLIHGVVYDGLMLGGVVGVGLLGAAFAVAASSRGGIVSQITLPVLGMAMVGLMIHVARGHSEAHFAVLPSSR